MFARTFRIITSLALLITAYWLYALVVVPQIEPAASAEGDDPAGPTFVEWPSPAEPASDRSTIAPRLSSGELELSLPGGVVIRWKL